MSKSKLKNYILSGEGLAVIATTFAVLFISRMEARLYELSTSLTESREFFSTLAYFALINVNVILILILSFLIFRNVTKLVFERKHGILGSKLKSKLVFSLVFFALSPTLLLFYVSTKFINTGFETWFSKKVQRTIEQTKELSTLVYKQDQKRLESLSQIAKQRLKWAAPKELYLNQPYKPDVHSLAGFAEEYGLSDLRILDLNGSMIWPTTEENLEEENATISKASFEIFLQNPYKTSMSLVLGSGTEDKVLGVSPLRYPHSDMLYGLLITEVRFKAQILKSIENILEDFSDLKPSAQVIRVSYLILMILITLLIVFFATWMGFFVAKRITTPLQILAEATKEVALGNYKIRLQERATDETGQLVQAFNQMTEDLLLHQKASEDAKETLQAINLELDRRGQSMEAVLKNASTGVLSLDSEFAITTFNPSAENLLGIKASQVMGKRIASALPPHLVQKFWTPLIEGLENKHEFHEQIEISTTEENAKKTLIVHATRFFDDSQKNVGFVLVFDDASEQVRAQRVLVWREVATRMAHEIKNPITPIKLSAERLLRRFGHKFEDADQDLFRSCLQTILTQVDSLRDLVNEFSKFTRLPKIKTQLLEVSEILKETCQFLSVSYPDIDFDFSIKSQPPPFLLDKEQLHRAFVNILNNAIAALDPKRRGKIDVRIFYFEKLKLVRIEIADNGLGIPADLQEKVMEPYFSTKKDGMGLGLAIVHQIVTDHRGYLRITDNKPFGALIILEFPISDQGEL